MTGNVREVRVRERGGNEVPGIGGIDAGPEDVLEVAAKLWKGPAQ
jgi:hypothetical protein